MFIVLGSRDSLSGISMSGSFSASSVSGSFFAATSSVLSLAACLSISSLMHGEKVSCSDCTGVGVSSLSKNPPVVSLLVSSVVGLDGGRRVQQGAEIQKWLEDDMVDNSLLLGSRR